MQLRAIICLIIGTAAFTSACKSKTGKPEQGSVAAASTKAQFKGLYSLGPNIRSFKDCTTGREYWVADSTRQLELKYWQLITAENQDQPVYIEVNGEIKPSDFEDADEAYPNTIIVRELKLITIDIPQGKCN